MLSGRALDWKLVAWIGVNGGEVYEGRGPMRHCRTTGRRNKEINILRVSRFHFFITQSKIMDFYNKKAVLCLNCIKNNFSNFEVTKQNLVRISFNMTDSI